MHQCVQDQLQFALFVLCGAYSTPCEADGGETVLGLKSVLKDGGLTHKNVLGFWNLVQKKDLIKFEKECKKRFLLRLRL